MNNAKSVSDKKIKIDGFKGQEENPNFSECLRNVLYNLEFSGWGILTTSTRFECHNKRVSKYRKKRYASSSVVM